jgi:hypothetical protein
LRSRVTVVLPALLAAVVLAGCGGSSAPQTSVASAPPPSPAVGAGGQPDLARVAALTALMVRVGRPGQGGYAILDDVTDQAQDGYMRQVQVTLGESVIVPCGGVFLPCSLITPRLIRLGFHQDVDEPNQDLAMDVAGMSDPALASLVERVFLDGLGASPDYQLTWTGLHQSSPARLRY